MQKNLILSQIHEKSLLYQPHHAAPLSMINMYNINIHPMEMIKIETCKGGKCLAKNLTSTFCFPFGQF